MDEIRCPHCDTPITEHEAGRCLDAWVAEAVMNWTEGTIYVREDAAAQEINDRWRVVPGYSTRIEDSWRVVESFGNDAWVRVERGSGPGDWFADLTTEDGLGCGWNEASSAPLAICRAAILAVS